MIFVRHALGKTVRPGFHKPHFSGFVTFQFWQNGFYSKQPKNHLVKLIHFEFL